MPFDHGIVLSTIDNKLMIHAPLRTSEASITWAETHGLMSLLSFAIEGSPHTAFLHSTMIIDQRI